MAFAKKSRLRIGIAAAVVLLILVLYHVLFSSIAMKRIWLPMVKQHTGVDFQVEQCSVSLFSRRTFSAEKVTVELPGWKASAGELFLSANPLGFLFSGKLTVADLQISGLRLEARRSNDAVKTASKSLDVPSESPRRQTVPSGNSVSERTKKTPDILIRKATLTDASLIFPDAKGNLYEFSKLDLSCSDVVPSGRAAMRFESLFRMTSGTMEISRTPVSGKVSLELFENSLVPSGIEAVFSSGKMTFSGKEIPPLDASLSIRLNAGWNAGRFVVRSSSLHLKDGAGAELLNAEINGKIDPKTYTGSLSAALTSRRSELLDALIRVWSGKNWKNVSLTAKVTASIADSGDAIVAEGSADLTADRLFDEIRSLGSRFSFKALKREDGVQFSAFQFQLRDGSGKLNLSAGTSSDFNWRYDLRKKTLTGTGSLDLQTANLNLPQVAGLFDESGRFPVKSGLFSLALKATPAGDGFLLRGNASLNQFSSSMGDVPAAPVNLSSVFSLKTTISPLGVVLDSCRLTGEAMGRKFLLADLKYAAPDLKAGFPMTAEFVLSELNEQVLPALPFKMLQNSAVERFRTEWNAGWRLTENGGQTVSLSGTVDGLSFAGAKQPLELSFGSRLALMENNLRIDALSLTASEQHRDFLDLNLSGNLRLPADSGTGRLSLSSKYIDAKKLQDLLLLRKEKNVPHSGVSGTQTGPAGGVPPSASAAKTRPSPETPQKEPAPLNLSAYSGIVDFAFEKIQYTDDVALTLHGPLEIDGSRIAAESLKLTANGAPVNLRFALDAGFADGYVYDLAFSMRNLLLPPLIKAVGNGKDYGVTGTVTSVDLKMEGKGVTPQNFKKNLKGSVKASTADLSFPAPSAEVIDALNLLFIPLNAVPDLTDALNLDALTGDLKTLSDNVSGILDGSKNVEFNQGTMDVSVSDGIVTLNRFLFEGGTLKSESVAGKINLLTGGLDLAASLNLGILVIPMKIGGTLSGPKPDFKEFLVQFAEKNVENLLDPDNIENTIQNVDSILQLFRRKKKK